MGPSAQSRNGGGEQPGTGGGQTIRQEAPRRLGLIRGLLPPQRTGLLLTENECARSTLPRVGTFRCDADLNVGRINGTIAERLGCDSNELFGQGWRPFLHRDDMAVAERAAADLKARRSGRYSLCSVAKSRDRLWLSVDTRIVFDGTSMIGGGVLWLEMWESPRTYLEMGNVARRT